MFILTLFKVLSEGLETWTQSFVFAGRGLRGELRLASLLPWRIQCLVAECPAPAKLADAELKDKGGPCSRGGGVQHSSDPPASDPVTAAGGGEVMGENLPRPGRPR